VRVLSGKIKSRFFSLMRHAGLLHLLPSEVWNTGWNVNSQPVGTGARALRYLSSYVFRTAISNHRILNVDDEHVLFRYTDTKTGDRKTIRLTPFEFIRRFLQHVLPKGFMKIRYYGFLHPTTSMPVKLAAALLEAMLAVPPERPKPIETTGIPPCERCHGTVQFVRFIPPDDPVPVSGFT
jgi:hypothetical protein